jgi:hypothetical protein
MNQIKSAVWMLAMLFLSAASTRHVAMNALLLLPAVALIVLGAHFYRAASWPLVLVCVVVLMLMAWRRHWVPRLVQTALLLGAVEWLRSAYFLVQQRLAMGQPWKRMTLILLAVALCTVASTLVFRHPRLRKWFKAN